MTDFRNPLVAIQAILIACVLLTFIVSVAIVGLVTLDDQKINDVTALVALTGAALAACRVWSSDKSQRQGMFWLIVTIACAALALSQWYEGRFEAFAYALHIEDLDDVLLLLTMPPIVLVGLRAKSVGRLVKAVLLVGLVAQLISTGMDLLDDWVAPSLAGGIRQAEIVVDCSELAFLQIYLTAFALFVAGGGRQRMVSMRG